MGAAASKPAPDPGTVALLRASVAAAQQGQLPDLSPSPADDDLRDLAGYQSASQKFLLAHTGNRFRNGFRIYHKSHYRRYERATMRDFHHVRYFKFRPRPLRNLAAHSKAISTLKSARPADRSCSTPSEVPPPTCSQRSVTAEEMPQGGDRHIPLKLPRCSKLLSIYGCINGEPVRCLLDPACQSQLCDTRFAKRFLTPTRLETIWYMGSHQQAPLTPIMECARAELDLNGHVEDIDCFVTDLQGYDLVLGLPWFEVHNPLLDFLTRTLTFSAHCTGQCTHSYSIEVRCDIQEDGCTVLASPDNPTPSRLLAMMAEIDADGNRRSARLTSTTFGTAPSPKTSKPPSKKRGRASAPKIDAAATLPQLSDDDLDETFQSGSAGDKRKVESEKAPKPRKRTTKEAGKILLSTPSSSLSQASGTPLKIDDIGFPLDESTQLLNKFVNLVRNRDIKERTGAPRVYTPSFEQPQHVLDLPLFAPKKRVYEFAEDKVKLISHTQPDGTSTKRWRMLARNKMNASVKEVELFVLPGEDYAVLTSDSCSEKSKVIELGKIAVDVMNKLPFDLEVGSWSSPKICRPRDFVTIVSLVRWKEIHHEEFAVSSMPCPSMTINKPSGKEGWRMSRLYWAWQTDAPGLVSRTLFSPKTKFDADAIMAEDFDGSDYPFLGKGPAQDDSNVEKAAHKHIQMCMYQLVGMIGTKYTITQKLEDLKAKFLTSMSRNMFAGPYNKANIWTITAPHRLHGEWALVPSAEVIKNLVIDGKVTTQPQGAIINLQNALTIRTTIVDPACLAWIAQQSLNALAKGEELVHILFAAVVAAQRLELGLITKKQVLDSYCLCENADDESHTDHFCTVCFKLRGCATLSKELTPEGIKPTCKGCGGRTFERSGGRYSIRNGIKYSVYDTRLADCKAHDRAGIDPPSYSESQLESSLYATHHTDDDAVWRDGYSDETVSIRDAVWPPAYRNLGFVHPASLSIEKPYQRWLFKDGSIGLHVPDFNSTLTKFCINVLKGDNAASVLPLWKKALQLRLSAAESTPRVGYHPDLTDEWKLLERAFDTQRVVSSFTSRGKRLEKGQDVTQLQKFMSMEKSGIWDGQTLRRAQIPQLWKLPTLGQRYVLHPDFSMTDEHWDWQIILRDIEQMERDVRPGGFNPGGLKLPRCGKNRIPWLWRTDMCPDESDYDEETIFAIFSARLRTMDKACDRNHTTEESPATLFLEAVAQWFETGGKCHFFGCVMTPFLGHATRFSFGRGLVQRRRAEDGGPVSISAGDRMQTGCTKLLPRDMATDYDIGRRTIVVESWAANKLRFDYPNLSDLLEKLISYVLNIKDSCEWYDGLSDDIDDYSKVQFPTKKDQESYRAAMRAQTSDADVQNDSDDEFDGDENELYADEDEEELDEEDALYAEHLREVDAMKAQSQAEPDVVSLEGKDEYSRLLEAAKALTCDGHSYVQERLKELSDLQSKLADDEQDAEENTKEQMVARIKVIVAELEEYMQKLAGDEDSSTPQGPANTLTSTPDDRSSRAEVFKSHLAELKSINFFPKELENILDAINANMEEDQQFTPEEAFGMLWRLRDEFPITVGAS